MPLRYLSILHEVLTFRLIVNAHIIAAAKHQNTDQK